MTDDASVHVLAGAGAEIGETPLWHNGAIWWTDPVERRLLRADGHWFEAVPVDNAIWSLAALEGEGLVGSLDDRFARIGDDGTLKPGPVAKVAAGCRFNDMTAGADGTLWVGAMHRGVLATRGSLYRAAGPDAVPVQVAGGLGVPNGMKLSGDGTTLFVIDTLSRTLLAYPLVVDGLGEPVIVTDFLGLPGKPDGMTIDARGHFWVAMWGGSCVVEIGSNGAALRQIDLPAPHVSSVGIARDGRLLVSTSRMRLSPAALAASPLSGALFEIRLGEGL
ncbi:MAG TPA: SMP-30/gluconolactonase/LRE family protein [Sphingomonas sp.]|nr:SMP-30/gluconolactonase/LRE family protein [Sphingomonas sp.]